METMYFDEAIRNHDWYKCTEDYNQLNEEEKATKEMTVFGILLKIAEMEAGDKNNKVDCNLFFREDCQNLNDMIELYYKVKYFLRRIEYEINSCDGMEIVKLEISKSFLLMMISLFSVNKKKVILHMQKCYSESKNNRMVEDLQQLLSLQ